MIGPSTLTLTSSFVAVRIVNRIEHIIRTVGKVSIQVCKHVIGGFFRNHEVFTEPAPGIMNHNATKCRKMLGCRVSLKHDASQA